MRPQDWLADAALLAVIAFMILWPPTDPPRWLGWLMLGTAGCAALLAIARVFLPPKRCVFCDRPRPGAQP